MIIVTVYLPPSPKTVVKESWAESQKDKLLNSYYSQFRLPCQQTFVSSVLESRKFKIKLPVDMESDENPPSGL